MWKSSCSIASDDENSRQSFLSDCDSEFDLRPPPRYPAEKRSSSTLNKQLNGRIEPPLTRSRAKAIGKTIITPEPMPKQRRHSALRRSIDAFTGMATTLTNNSILFSKQESSNDRLERNEFSILQSRVPNSPLDGVNILADRFESCSLDEGKFSKNCLWPSRETNSHYMRPVTSSFPTTISRTTPFSTLNNTPLFAQPSPSNLFGQQQAQLWSRFRFAASTLRNDSWFEQVDSTPQHYPSNIFTPNHNSFNLTDQSSPLFFRQHKTTPTVDSEPPVSTKEDNLGRQSSSSKIFFTLMIFAVGLVLGYLLTNTLPPVLLWKLCVQYFHLLYVYLQSVVKYFRLAE